MRVKKDISTLSLNLYYNQKQDDRHTIRPRVRVRSSAIS